MLKKSIAHKGWSDKKNSAIVLHLVSFVPVAVLGFVFMWQAGLTLGGLRHMHPERTDQP